MITDDLRKLALAATPTKDWWKQWADTDEHFTLTCSPERILALLDVIDAARAMRSAEDLHGGSVTYTRPGASRPDCERCEMADRFDAALAQLERGTDD